MKNNYLKYMTLALMVAVGAVIMSACSPSQKATTSHYSPRNEGRTSATTKKRSSSNLFAMSAKGRSGKVTRGSSLPCPDPSRMDVRRTSNRPKRPVYISGMPIPDDEPVAQQPRQETLPDPTVPKVGTIKRNVPPAEVDKLTPATEKPAKPVLNPLYFVFDEDELTAEDLLTIRTAADYIRFGYNIVIEGHTDNYGSEEYNSLLALKRAQRIKRIMVEKTGVPADKIAVLALGETQPKVPNDTPANRQLNRRVEIKVVD
jgi:outer membrane protein OmpA-like peptidoglycan-associated protein